MWARIYLFYVPQTSTPRYYPIGKVANYQAIHGQTGLHVASTGAPLSKD